LRGTGKQLTHAIELPDAAPVRGTAQTTSRSASRPAERRTLCHP
jgi:hypothetical protein